MGDIIVVKDLWHIYEGGDAEIAAVRGVDLSIEEGEFLAIVGPNGSGKSTLAKHFNGLLLPSRGQVWVAGHQLTEEATWEARQRVGMVFQNPDNQMVATTVEEDVAFGPENLGVPSAEIGARVRESLKTVGMEGMETRAPHHLSGGQKQRVAIAGVLAMHSRVVVLDEPTAMLDPSGRAEVLATITDLNRRRGITVVLITHFMSEAMLANRVLVMDEGKVVMEGKPREVFSQAGRLRRHGLDLPQITQLAEVLRRKGLDVSLEMLDVDEMVDALCPLLSTT